MKGKFTVSVKPEIWDRAQKLGFNMSGEVENALRIRTQATIKDAPDESLILICSLCSKKVEFGYLCRERNKFVCPDCEKDWDCKVGEDHEHIRLPAYDLENDKKVDIRDDFIKKVAVQVSKR
jgi:hypothetical protein